MGLPIQENAIPIYLFPWHLPVIDFLGRIPKESKILELCTGMGIFLYYLYRNGFENLFGVDDSHFQPYIVRAADRFLSFYGVRCKLYDFYIGYRSNYAILSDILPVDVIILMGADYDIYFDVHALLRQNGYLIIENLMEGVPNGLERYYKPYGIFSGYGRRGGFVSILQKI